MLTGQNFKELVMDEFIKQVNPNELFKTKEEVRNWIFNNPQELERVIGKELSYTKYFTEASYDIRPDIYTEEKQTAYRIAVMITLEKLQTQISLNLLPYLLLMT